MARELLEVGFGGFVAINRVLVIGRPRSLPIQRMVHRAREEGLLIDVTYGHRIGAVLFLDSGQVALVALEAEEIMERLRRQRTIADITN